MNKNENIPAPDVGPMYLNVQQCYDEADRQPYHLLRVLDFNLDNLVKYELKVVNVSGNTLYINNKDMIKKGVSNIALIHPDQFQHVAMWKRDIDVESIDKDRFYGFNTIAHRHTRSIGAASLSSKYVYIVDKNVFEHIVTRQIGRKCKILTPIMNNQAMVAGFTANFDVEEFIPIVPDKTVE